MTSLIQNIIAFEQNQSGIHKTKAIEQFGNELCRVKIISIQEALPPVIDDGFAYLPEKLHADLVLDFLKHPDLSHDLAMLCQHHQIPVVASGKKIKYPHVYTPPTCCGLKRHDCLGHYAARFGAPEFLTNADNGKIEHVDVVRGAPCGATWKAVARIIGLPIKDAIVRIGLEVQYFCYADPSGWDPIWGKSPLHFAGKIHSQALKNSLGLMEET